MDQDNSPLAEVRLGLQWKPKILKTQSPQSLRAMSREIPALSVLYPVSNFMGFDYRALGLHSGRLFCCSLRLLRGSWDLVSRDYK